MTNTDVVRFVEQGYSTEAIIQMINAARSVEFRISPEHTSQLEKLGVSKEIIDAMIRRASTSESTQATNQPIPVAPPTEAAPTAWPPATGEFSLTLTASVIERMDPVPRTLPSHWFDPIDDDELDTARRQLRDVAEKACGELDARTLNILSFHLGAYLCNVKANNGTLKVYGDDAWVTHIMGEIEAELRGWESDYGKVASRRIRAELHNQRWKNKPTAEGE